MNGIIGDEYEYHNPDGGFRPIGSFEPTPLFRQRPGDDEGYRVFDGKDGFACFVRCGVLRDMRRWAQQDSGTEKIGRLWGRQCEDSRGCYVLVEKATLNRHASSGTATVVANNEAQSAALEESERACRPFCCVGWWHSHPPGCGAFYSSVDRDNQRTWNHANAIGIVIDPASVHHALKVYRGPESAELVPAVDLFAPVDGRMPPTAGDLHLAEQEVSSAPADRDDTRTPLESVNAEKLRNDWTTVGLILAVLVSISSLTMSIVTYDLVFLTLRDQYTTMPGDRTNESIARDSSRRVIARNDTRIDNAQEPLHETETAGTDDRLISSLRREDE